MKPEETMNKSYIPAPPKKTYKEMDSISLLAKIDKNLEIIIPFYAYCRKPYTEFCNIFISTLLMTL